MFEVARIRAHERFENAKAITKVLAVGAVIGGGTVAMMSGEGDVVKDAAGSPIAVHGENFLMHPASPTQIEILPGGSVNSASELKTVQKDALNELYMAGCSPVAGGETTVSGEPVLDEPAPQVPIVLYNVGDNCFNTLVNRHS